MEVVLASGDIINANATSHADLFRALKGGQNNFGVVTRFDLQSYPQGPFWGGAVQYPQEADDAQLEAFTRFKDPKRYDPDTASVEQTFIYYGEFGSFFSSNTIYSSKPIVNASGLQLFTDIRPQQGTTMRISNTTDFATELELLQPVNQ
jgi:FAD/FMN-containing dehydrogenase